MNKNRFITITPSNMMNIAGRINRFFKKPTCRYDGIRQHVVGTTWQDFGGEELPIPVTERRETYTPFVGTCCEHHMYKEARLKTETHPWDIAERKARLTGTLLAIQDVYEDHCLPIHNGNKIFIGGDCMIILKNDIYMTGSVCGTKYHHKCRQHTEQVVFYHRDYDPSELAPKIRGAINAAMYDLDTWYLYDAVCGWEEDVNDQIMRRLLSDASHIICHYLDNVDVNQSVVEKKIHLVDHENQPFTLRIDVDAFRKGLPEKKKVHDAISFVYENKVYHDTGSVINAMLT